MIKAVIFDMDGLLIDSEPLWQEVESEIFSRVTEKTITPLMTTQTMGRRLDEAIEYWYEQYPWQTPTRKEVEGEIMKGILGKVKSKGKAMPGVYEVIKLCKVKKIPMGIASSSYMELIHAVVDRLDIRKDMQILHSAEHEPYGKPHPAVYITAAKMLGVQPQDCLVFEDAPNGVLAAKAAFMTCIAVPNEHVKNNKIFCIADYIINSLEDFSTLDIL